MKHLSLVCAVGILALMIIGILPSRPLFSFAESASTGMLHQAPAKPEGPPPIVKAFPPEISTQFDKAQEALKLAGAQLQAAQANYESAQLQIQNLIFRAAAELDLSKKERETCPYGQVKTTGAWVFQCPADKPADKKDTTAKP